MFFQDAWRRNYLWPTSDVVERFDERIAVVQPRGREWDDQTSSSNAFAPLPDPIGFFFMPG